MQEIMHEGFFSFLPIFLIHLYSLWAVDEFVEIDKSGA